MPKKISLKEVRKTIFDLEVTEKNVEDLKVIMDLCYGSLYSYFANKEDNEDFIRDLREQITNLKKERKDLKEKIDDLETDLEEQKSDIEYVAEQNNKFLEELVHKIQEQIDVNL